jgi:hypothetical protein
MTLACAMQILDFINISKNFLHRNLMGVSLRTCSSLQNKKISDSTQVLLPWQVRWTDSKLLNDSLILTVLQSDGPCSSKELEIKFICVGMLSIFANNIQLCCYFGEIIEYYARKAKKYQPRSSLNNYLVVILDLLRSKNHW